MARRFRKKAGVGVVLLPGLPGLGNDTAVEGDEYARFCPAILDEVFDAPAKPVGKKAASVSKPTGHLKEVVVLPDAASFNSPEEDEGEPPNMSWKKAELVEYAKGLGLEVEGMNKAEILEAIEEEEG